MPNVLLPHLSVSNIYTLFTPSLMHGAVHRPLYNVNVFWIQLYYSMEVSIIKS